MEQVKAIRTKTGFRVTHINRRRACRLMCVECMGWAEGEVNNCNTACPLSDFRNMTGEQNVRNRDKATRKFCLECMNENAYLISQCTAVYCPLYPYRNRIVDRAVLFDRDVPDKIVLEKTKDILRERAEALKNTHQEVWGRRGLDDLFLRGVMQG